MQSLLHSCKPAYNVFTPLWIIRLPRITLHPRTIYVDTTCIVVVLHTYIICGNAIIAVFAGWLPIRFYLPGYQSRVGKIERDIWITEFIGGRDSITFVEYPVRMDGFPVSQIFVCTTISECPTITMKGNVVANKNFWIA